MPHSERRSVTAICHPRKSMEAYTYDLDPLTHAVVTPGRFVFSRGEIVHEVESSKPGSITLTMHDNAYYEWVDVWAMETKDYGLHADLKTGEVFPHIMTATVVVKRDAWNGSRHPNVLTEAEKIERNNRISQLQRNYHCPVHGIIGPSKPEWAGTNAGALLAERRVWARTIFKPENLLEFRRQFAHLF